MDPVIREWAVGGPQRYLLIYGTPVPGYQAPADTLAISNEIMAVLIDTYRKTEVPSSGRPFEAHVDDHRQWASDPSVPAATLRQALAFWTRVHGILSLELAGHFAGMGFDPALLFADEIDDLLGR